MNVLPVDYSPKMVDLLMDGSKVMLSLTTGFLTIVVASTRYLYDHDLMKRARRVVLLTFVLGLASVGFWILSMGTAVVTAKAFGLPKVTDAEAAELTLRLKCYWILAVYSTRAALGLFFSSLITYCAMVVHLFWNGPERITDG